MIFKGNGVVWDDKKNKVMCRFKDGVLETKDAYIIDRLKSLGYEHEGEEPVKKEPVKRKPRATAKKDEK